MVVVGGVWYIANGLHRKYRFLRPKNESYDAGISVFTVLAKVRVSTAACRCRWVHVASRGVHGCLPLVKSSAVFAAAMSPEANIPTRPVSKR